mgnify:CR=1 FL=1
MKMLFDLSKSFKSGTDVECRQLLTESTHGIRLLHRENTDVEPKEALKVVMIGIVLL